MANSYIKLIPDALKHNIGLPDRELKCVYLKAMPTSWQDNFINAGKSANKETLQ